MSVVGTTNNIPSAIVLTLGNTVVFVLCCIKSAFLSSSFLSVKKRFARAAFVTQLSVVVVVQLNTLGISAAQRV